MPCAVSWLVAIAARGGPAGAGARQPDLAACAARDALRLLLRDDSDHFRILCAPNVAELLQLQAALQAQQPHCNTSASSTRRCSPFCLWHADCSAVKSAMLVVYRLV